MSARTFQVELTASQFAALADAVAARAASLEDERVRDDVPTRAESLLDRAWKRIKTPYYEEVSRG